ncbi:Transposable element Tc3 transposase [Blattella germanica]|nr:Transposable element Tc3 transposase [Blattella germanica]
MGRKAGLSSFEQAQVKTYKEEGYSSRDIARRLSRSPCVINNFLKLGNNYEVKKSTGRPQKLTPRQKRQVIRTGGSSLGQLARDPTINVHK